MDSFLSTVIYSYSKQMARVRFKSLFVFLLLFVSSFTIWTIISTALELLQVNHSNCLILDKHPSEQATRQRQKPTPVPYHIHQIYFNVTDTPMPERFLDVKASWKRCHPDFSYTLWNETMVEALIDAHYPHMKALYLSYSHWVRRVDVARMFILHTYGGIYIDMDIKCRDGIQGLLAIIPTNAGIGLYKTEPFGVASDFIIARQHHPFMRHLLCSLKNAKRNYILPFITTMMSTGPLFISLCLHTYQHKEDIYLYSHLTISRFVRHVEGETWHQLDGQIVWWMFNHGYDVVKILTYLAIAVAILLYLYKQLFTKFKAQRPGSKLV